MTPFPTAGAVSLADHAQDFRALVFDAFDEIERKCAEELGIRLEMVLRAETNYPSNCGER